MLREQGHTVHVEGAQRDDWIGNYDLVLGPTCWRMTEELRKYLPLAVKNAQRAKKGLVKKNA